MKLTWFGETTFRIHIGGQIIVIDAAAAPPPTDVTELRSGSDLEIELGAGLDGLPALETGWRPPRAGSVLEEAEATSGVLVRRVGEGGLLLHATGEAPLVLIGGEAGSIGRWSRDAVVVLQGAAADGAAGIVERLEPKLVLLAVPEAQVEALVGSLRSRMGGTALVALEAGLALEA